MSARKKCGGILHYEVVCGMRIFFERDGKKEYKFRCSECYTPGINNGRAKTCQRQRNSVDAVIEHLKSGKIKKMEVRRLIDALQTWVGKGDGGPDDLARALFGQTLSEMKRDERTFSRLRG
jgi:hypothetical protein